MSSKFAIPVSYADPRSGIGSVNVVASKGPPLSVQQWTEADGEDNKHIAIEFEDIIKTVERDHGLADSEVMRLCLHLADTRKLTHNLITRLAESGDRVAKRIHQIMNESMEVVRALDNAPTALCNLHLTSLDKASFSLSWPIESRNPNVLDMRHTDWPVPLGEPTKNPVTFSMERLRQQEEVFTLLRIIRKYAELMGLLIKMRDDNQILRGIDYKPILEPYNFSESIVATCRVYRVSDGEIKLDIDPVVNIRTTEETLVKDLFNLASIAFNKNMQIKFIDPGKVLANHNLPNIFGKNLYVEPTESLL